jgi:hypothetical protein
MLEPEIRGAMCLNTESTLEAFFAKARQDAKNVANNYRH